MSRFLLIVALLAASLLGACATTPAPSCDGTARRALNGSLNTR